VFHDGKVGAVKCMKRVKVREKKSLPYKNTCLLLNQLPTRGALHQARMEDIVALGRPLS